LAHEIQLEIENDALEQGIVFNNTETESLSQQAAENLLGRSMKKWKSDKFWNELKFTEDPKWRRRKSLMGKSTERRLRGSVASRGLGDVYKRQNQPNTGAEYPCIEWLLPISKERRTKRYKKLLLLSREIHETPVMGYGIESIVQD